MSKIVIIGATSTIANNCGRLWAKQNSDFVLVGRNEKSLQKITDDLKVRGAGKVNIEITDFKSEKSIKLTVDKIAKLGKIDIVLIAHGVLPDQQQCQNDIIKNNQSLQINAVSPVLFAEMFANVLEKQKTGNLAVIGSVSGDRGRKKNYIYGSAKSLIDTYVNGLNHRFANTNINISLIKPGPTQTNMTNGMNIKMASPESVALDIVNGIKNNKAVIYTPKKWGLIMTIIKNLPRFIFNKLDI